jgi:hypothetical protein
MMCHKPNFIVTLGFLMVADFMIMIYWDDCAT